MRQGGGERRAVAAEQVDVREVARLVVVHGEAAPPLSTRRVGAREPRARLALEAEQRQREATARREAQQKALESARQRQESAAETAVQQAQRYAMEIDAAQLPRPTNAQAPEDPFS